ncbi:MAG: M12 family metallo-peptidase, partial [Armatimonadota bacterium]
IALVEKWLCPICSKLGWRSDLVLQDVIKRTGMEVDYRFKLESIDLWETVGIGPLDPALLGCKPNHTDVIIVFRIRSNMTQATIQPTIDRLKKYYAGLPNKNPDGTTGVNMIAIVPPPMPKETDNMGYIQLYDQAMPKEWRGLAHGILVDNSGGGGGQSNRPDWCGCGYNWHTMAHELGHQFGLPHEPMGARTGSPFHPSMMNYDYSYQLNGNGEAITYSTGKFKKMEMKESDLNEVVQFPIGDLEFLSKRPYFFKLKKLTETTTAIDWNRNGIFGENHVRADVNDGYSAAYRDEIRIGKTAGAPALASMGKSLAVIFPDFQKPEGYDKFDKSGLTVEKPGNLKVRVITDHKAGSIQRLADDVTGDPSTIFMNRKLWLGFPMAKGYGIKSFTVKEGEFEEQTFDRLGSAGMIPTLVASPEAPFLLTWNPTTHLTTISAVDGDDARPLEGMDSTNPVGGVWNTKRNCLSLAATVLQDKKANRIRIFNYKQDAAMAWKLLDTIWIEGVSGNAAAGSRCQIVFDDTKDRGPNGGYNVYLKGNYPDPNQAGLNNLCRQIEDKTLSDGWRVKMMGNEWANTRSVCGVAVHDGDIAFAMSFSWGS